jgi:hypothetical protein
MFLYHVLLYQAFVPCTIAFVLVLLKTLFLSLVPFTTVCCISQKKIVTDAAKIVLRAGPEEGLPLRFPSRIFGRQFNRTEDKNHPIPTSPSKSDKAETAFC